MQKATPILLLLSFFLLSFVMYRMEVKPNIAEVESNQGMFIFYRSKPLMEYEYIGTYKVQLIWENKPNLLFDKLIRKTKDKFPNADAIIINDNMDKCDAIRFKK